ncbi:MAG: hypothetical protein ACYC54_02460 [Sedimentisphaerales bacterium]
MEKWNSDGGLSAKRKPAGPPGWLLEFVVFNVFRICVKPSV